MFEKYKVSVKMEKMLKREYDCRYNNQLYTCKFRKIPLVRMFFIDIVVFIIAVFLLKCFFEDIILGKGNLQIKLCENRIINDILELLISIVIMIVTVLLINYLAKLFWKLICAVKSVKYCNDFEIYNLNVDTNKMQPLSKFDYIFGIIFSSCLIGLVITLIASYIKYDILFDAYTFSFVYAINAIIFLIYLLFKKCDYVIPAYHGFIYLNKKE